METRSNVPSEHATPGEMQKQTPGKSRPPPPRAREAALFTWPQTGTNPNVPNRMTVVFFHKMEYSSAIFKNLLICIKTRTNFKSILVREGSQTQERPAF